MPRKEAHRMQERRYNTSFRLTLRQRVNFSLWGEDWSSVALPTPAVFHVRNLPPAQVQSFLGFQQLHERLVKSMTPLVYRKSLKPSHSQGRCSDILWMNNLEGVEVEVSSTQRPLIARKFSSSTSGLLTYSTYPEDEMDS